MNNTPPFHLGIFREKARQSTRRLRRYLTRLENNTPRGIDKKVNELEKQVWKDMDCLSCANCCKTMTPTFTKQDIKRISAHFEMTPDAFREKWLRKERGGERDWLNKTEPCQFLDLTTNKCSIYAIRPADCAGFPHLGKKFIDFSHIHKQNVEFCPATNLLVERMMVLVAAKG